MLTWLVMVIELCLIEMIVWIYGLDGVLCVFEFGWVIIMVMLLVIKMLFLNVIVGGNLGVFFV